MFNTESRHKSIFWARSVHFSQYLPLNCFDAILLCKAQFFKWAVRKILIHRHFYQYLVSVIWCVCCACLDPFDVTTITALDEHRLRTCLFLSSFFYHFAYLLHIFLSTFFYNNTGLCPSLQNGFFWNSRLLHNIAYMKISATYIF
jgi:hypothetical protein